MFDALKPVSAEFVFLQLLSIIDAHINSSYPLIIFLAIRFLVCTADWIW